MSESFDFVTLDVFTVGTIGEPGRRTFYLQARAGARAATFKVEKQQVAALADYLAKLLADLPEAEPAMADMELETFVEEAWAVGPIGVAYDAEHDVVLIEAQERLTEDSRGEAAMARFALTRAQAAAMARLGEALVVSGRPPCPHCGHPLGDDHVCPKTNGSKPPAL